MKNIEEESGSEGQQQDVEVESKDEVHPYKYELSQFKPNSWQLEEKEPQMYSSLEDSKVTMVDSQSLLEEMMLKLKEVKELAIDLQHHKYRSFRGIVCLVQISTRTEDFIIDSLILKDELKVLNEVCTDSNILKVFHGSERDLEWLQRDFGVYFINMFDTHKAARVVQELQGIYQGGISIQHILKKYCKLDVKRYTTEYHRIDWRIRPLPDGLVKYAREDVHYLLYIHDIYRNLLLKDGKEVKKLLDVYRACTAVCGVMWPPDKLILQADSYLACYKRVKVKLNIQELECFRLLYEWRHIISQENDEGTGYTLPNKMMIKISKSLPKEPKDIATCCDQVPPLVQQHLEDVHNLVLQAIKNVPEVPKEPTQVKKDSSKGKEPVKKGKMMYNNVRYSACLACGRLGHQANECVYPSVHNHGLRPPRRGRGRNTDGFTPDGAYPPGGPGMRGRPGFQNYYGRGPRHMGPLRMHPYAHPHPHHPLGGNNMDGYNTGANPYDVPFNPYSQPAASPYKARGHPRGIAMYYY